MRVFKSKWFARFARDEGITDTQLWMAIKNAEAGMIDANYGGSVIKLRIARTNEGKSGGYRSIVFYRQGSKAFFVFGYSKKNKGNLNKEEERLYKDSAKIVLAYSDAELDQYVASGVYKEVKCHG